MANGSLSTSGQSEEPWSRPGGFVTTQWTQVLEARGDSPEAKTALSELCAAYYAPVFAFIRRNAPEVWAEIQEFRHGRVKRHMLDLLDQGVAQGVLRKDLDRETLVRLYLTMTSALLSPELSGWESGEQIAPVFETFVRVYFEGLITDAGRRGLAGKKP